MRLIIFINLIAISAAMGQSTSKEALPYREITKTADNFTAGTVTARLLDGLGFRFYWATDNLREEDLSYKPVKEARTYLETVEHIYGMSMIIVNTARKVPTTPGKENEKLSFQEMRLRTLKNIEEASEIFSTLENENLGDHKMVFKGTSNEIEFPLWNLINGPISDCLWHVGQLVSFRRSSGNPFNSKVSVLSGKLINEEQ